MRDKFGYMFGDFGNDFFFILVSAFLMVFYTDVFRISPATVGVLFLLQDCGMRLQMWLGVDLLIQEKQLETENLNLGFLECPSHLLLLVF